ncbi:hypothetical protein HUU61_00455 [Rhodopseudomonas palustris]|nr:hypothetical protein [Rhodopseudomonas palustris]
MGITYAPLFVGLDRLFAVIGFGAWATVPAAALTTAAVTVLTSAQQVAVAASLVGVTVASFGLLIMGSTLPLGSLATAAAVAGIIAGLVVRFPQCCTWHVAGKAFAAAVTGILCGTVLVFAKPLVEGLQSPAGAVAFLISINGMFYVAVVRQWIEQLGCASQGSCQLRQALVIGLIAMLTAASVWVVGASVTGRTGDAITDALLTLPHVLPLALASGAITGVITGALLEIFEFRWVHDA